MWLTAAASIVGGILARRDAKKTDSRNAKAVKQANKENAKAVAAANAENERIALRNREWAQEDYAQQKADMSDQFVRIRDAAQKAGFNPLTALASGAPMVPTAAGGLAGYSAMAPQAASANFMGPPLASTEMLVNGVQDVGNILSGREALDIAEQKSRIELNRIQAEQLGALPMLNTRGGASRRAAASVAAGDAPSGWTGGFAPTFWRKGSPLDADRSVEMDATHNVGGFIEIENDWTGGGAVYAPGSDGDVMDLDELLVAGAFAYPQVIWRNFKAGISNPAPNSVVGKIMNPGPVGRHYSQPDPGATYNMPFPRHNAVRFFTPALTRGGASSAM